MDTSKTFTPNLLDAEPRGDHLGNVQKRRIFPRRTRTAELSDRAVEAAENVIRVGALGSGH